MKLTFRGNSYEVPAPIQLGPDNRMERTVVQSGQIVQYISGGSATAMVRQFGRKC